MWVVWVGPCVRLRLEAAPERQERVDQHRRAVARPAILEVVEEVLLAERREDRVLPAEVQRQQVPHEVYV